MIGNNIKKLRITCLIIALLATISTSAAQNPAVTSSPASTHLLTAEITYITYSFSGLNRYPTPARIELQDADIFYSHASSQRINGKTTYYLHYTYQAVEQGNHKIPPVTFRSEQGNITSDEIHIQVYPKNILTKKSTQVGGKELTYYTLLKPAKSTLFPNETTALEYKTYLPESINIALWGLPLGEQKNCTAWRFSTPSNRSQISRARINGQTYQAGSFHTNLTSLKQGKASIGPLKSRVVFHASIMTNRGIATQQFDIKLLSDQLHLNIIPLPAAQPDHFLGDVGTYTMSALIDSPPEISENDSIQIISQLKGTGNLATVNPPSLTDLEGWKIISQNRTDLGDNRKSATGIAEFTYLIQPDLTKTTPTKTPSITFAALNPSTQIYHSSKIPAKNITIIPSSTTKQPTSDPQKPFDSLITNPLIGAYPHPWYTKLPISLIYIIPITFILALSIRTLRRRLHHKKLANSDKKLKLKDLADLEKIDTLFLKGAGAYIERWIDTDAHPQAREILSLRDSLCFRPESRQDVSPERRKKIIATLRKSSLLLTLLLSLSTLLTPNTHASTATTPEATLQAAITSFQQKNYPAAIKQFTNLPHYTENPDILYNIALSHQLQKAPGIAAYYYHAALAINPHHPAATKNLHYIENQNSSITPPKLTQLLQWTQKLHPSTYLHLTIFLISIIPCLILTFIYLKPRATPFKITIILTIFTPLLLAITIYSYLSHPDRNTYRLHPAVILDTSTLTSQPLNSSQIIIEAPPASRCHLIAQRGNHSYIIMANGIKGWIKTTHIKTY